MPAAARLNDHTAGHGGFSSVPIIEGSPNVFINGRPAARLGDAAQAHSHDGESHQGRIASGSAHVLINGRRAARVGDALSCGDSIAEGSHNVTIGDGGDGSAAIETVFQAQKRRILRSPDCTEEDRLILCLPDIAEAEAMRAGNAADAQGWSYLAAMFKKWMTGAASTVPQESEPFIISQDWLEQSLYASEKLREIREELFTENAVNLLKQRLEEQGLLTARQERFSFASGNPSEWRRLYHQSKQLKGIMAYIMEGDGGIGAALGSFQIYALAGGTVTPMEGGGHCVTVTEMGIRPIDIFAFEDEDYLGCWSCEELRSRPVAGAVLPGYGVLSDEDFRIFRDRHGVGGDFYVTNDIVSSVLENPEIFIMGR